MTSAIALMLGVGCFLTGWRLYKFSRRNVCRLCEDYDPHSEIPELSFKDSQNRLHVHQWRPGDGLGTDIEF